MAYILKKSDGETLTVLNDGQVDTALTSLTLVGKNVSGYGNAQNENYLYLLENFSNSSAIGGQPTSPIKGQLWFDSNPLVNRLLVYDGTAWRPLAVSIYGSTTTNTLINATSDPAIPYASSQPGDLWFNSSTKQLYVVSNTQSGTTLIGPENVVGFGTTKMTSVAMADITGQTHPVIQTIIDGEVVSIQSNVSFVATTTNALVGFPTIYRGTTFKNYTSSTRYTTATTDVVLHGLHEQLDQTYPRRNVDEHLQGNWSIDTGNVLNFGTTSQSSISWSQSNSLLLLSSNTAIRLNVADVLLTFDGNSITPQTSLITLGTSSTTFGSVYALKVSSGNPAASGSIEGNWNLTNGSQFNPQSDLSATLGTQTQRFNGVFSNLISAGTSTSVGTLVGNWQVSTSSLITPISDLGVNLGQNSSRFGTLYVSTISGLTSLVGTLTVVGSVLPNVDNTYSLGSSTTNWSTVYTYSIQTPVAVINTVTSANATFGFLTANTGSITNLVSTTASFVNILATTGNIGTLTSTSANLGTVTANTFIGVYGTITNVVSKGGSIDTLSVITGTVTNLQSMNSTISNLTATNASINGFTASNAIITNLTATTGVISNLYATTGSIGSFAANNLFVNNTLTASNSVLTTLSATTGTITNLNSSIISANNGIFNNLTGSAGTIGTFSATIGTVTTLSASTVTAGTLIISTTGTINNLAVTVGSITTANVTNLVFTNLKDGSSHVINSFDTDGTLSSNSDLKLSTQKAVKTYVDNSTTYLLNLLNNVSVNWTAPGTIGSLTPNTGAFTSLVVNQIYSTSTPMVVYTPNNGTVGAIKIVANDSTNLGYIQFTNHLSTQTGYIKVDSSGTFTWSGPMSASDFIATSDERLKSNILSIENALDTVTQLRGTTFNKVGSDKIHLGLIAQEVQKIIPELVHQGEDGYLGVAYGNVVALLIEAIKEQQKQISRVPVGSVFFMATDKVPDGYLACDGRLYLTIDYLDLFSEIGYAYGGEGLTFSVPDYRKESGINLFPIIKI